MSLACSRSLFFMAFIAGALAVGVSYYLEYAVGLTPCGLCLLQRWCLLWLTAVCLVATLHGPRRLGSALYWLLGWVGSVAGMATAWRQVVVQTDPLQQAFTCAPEPPIVSLRCVLQQLFNSRETCVEISWTLFDLSVPEWSLMFFLLMTILCAYQLLRIVWRSWRRPLSGESSHLRGQAD
jgi:disulfide bond formation protein DsbB